LSYKLPHMALEQGFYLNRLSGDLWAREAKLIMSETRRSFLCRLCLDDQEIYGYLIPDVGGPKFHIPAVINPDYSGPWPIATKQEIQKIMTSNRHYGIDTIRNMLGKGNLKRPIDFNIVSYYGGSELGNCLFYGKLLGKDAAKATASRRALAFMILLEEQTGLILEPVCKE
jgi:hypothetical protein